ncbi:ankyrin repeat-containing domain protein [Dunaliella salina]|uniref:Ankyrin repeat-containing domain protein n=1 Tax=Dunaliella salina TaxID=3046 RepID=A0ABQ7H7P1_DUNSA|nr:ankyrin repeat-containing domain protein [Dunaliella salina]|eukprot:KAF5842872.1 ankyrin repeat-containing domain protein [Dunaliella salina]
MNDKASTHRGKHLCNAAFKDDVVGAKALLQTLEDEYEKASTVNWVDEETGTSALWVAAWRGSLAMVELCIHAGADVNLSRTKGGYTPLLIATANKHLQVVQALLKRGASPDASDEAGICPLFVAAGLGRSDIVKELIDHGASIDQQNKEGWTPLAAACHRQKMNVVRQLILSGASVDAIPSGSWEKRLAKRVRNEIELHRSNDGVGQ